MTELECLPYGVGHADEGVCLLMQLGPHRVLLDCGLTTIAPLTDPSQKALLADAVLCTHAHADHARGLLDLHTLFPSLPIYASDVTARLLPLNWIDRQNVPDFCQALPWRSPVELANGLTAQIYPAGHLPGAAAILLTYTGKQRPYTVFYTGDFLLSNSRLVEGLPLEELRGLKPDVLIVEGSYGTSRHSRRRQQENQFAEKIHQAISRGQSVLLPTPTLGLGQELLMLLRSHHHFTGRDLDIWVDGSVADGCEAYLELLPYFPSAVQNFARHQPLFWDERIRPRVRRLNFLNSDLLSESAIAPPCVIITDRAADLESYCSMERGPWLLLLPQKPGQIGSTESAVSRSIERSPLLQEHIQSGDLIIDSYFLGDHCDGPSTTQLIHNIRPQHVIFIHGSPTYLADLTSLEELQSRYQIHLPSAGTVVELPVGEMFLQPAPPDAKFEGELTELETLAMITLPDPIMVDPRWQSFADTGLIEARWQGEELVLRGLSQQELLNQNTSLPLPASAECCKNCLHYRGQRCWNQSSPLNGFKVTPDGYCPEFEILDAALERPRIEADD